jgi:hypothetical protein
MLKVWLLSKEKKMDLKELIRYYFSSRATEYSRFFTGLTGALLTALSIYTLKERRTDFKNGTLDKGNRLTIIISLSIALSVVAGLSFTGLLQSSKTVDHSDMVIKINLGEWGKIQTGSKSSRAFYIENTCSKALTLDFFTENWSPIQVQDFVQVSWDYDGRPILPGHGANITLTLVNISHNVTMNFRFDIIVNGTEL